MMRVFVTEQQATSALPSSENSSMPVIKSSDLPAQTAHFNGTASDNAAIELAKRGVRTSIVALAPSVHDKGDKGFVPRMINIARDKGVSFSSRVVNGPNGFDENNREGIRA